MAGYLDNDKQIKHPSRAKYRCLDPENQVLKKVIKMPEEKRNISLYLFLGIVFLIVFIRLPVYKSHAAVSDAVIIKDRLKKRVETKKPKNRFICRRELICGVSLIPLFYERRGFAPAWCGDDGIFPQAAALISEISSALDEGLSPDVYHKNNIRSLLQEIEFIQALGETVDPDKWVDLELLLTDAFMMYGSHLLAGRVNPETIHTDWIVFTPAVDLISILQSALKANQIKQALRDLRPNHPGYTRLKRYLWQYREIAKKGKWSPILSKTSLRKGDRGISVQRLRERLIIFDDLSTSGDDQIDLFDETVESAVLRFQKRHGLKTDGVVGSQTLKILNIPIQERIRQMEINLERWRWIPHNLGDRYILANIADFKLHVTENLQRILDMRVVVGRPYRRTPVFSSKMTFMVINPYWNIPTSIAVKDILPRMRQTPTYIAQQGIKVFKNWSNNAQELDHEAIDWKKMERRNFTYKLRQEPGPKNALGRVKFMFPNKFAVYLHDTPKHSLFKELIRDFSSGCIRVEKPIDLALYLLKDDPQWTREILLQTVKTGKRKVVELKKPIPVHLLYWTAWVDESDMLYFRDDIYDRDRPLDRALKEKPPGV